MKNTCRTALDRYDIVTKTLPHSHIVVSCGTCVISFKPCVSHVSLSIGCSDEVSESLRKRREDSLSLAGPASNSELMKFVDLLASCSHRIIDH